MAGSNPDLVIRVAANIAALQTDMAAAVATLKQIEGATKDTATATTAAASSLDSFGDSMIARVTEGVLLRDVVRAAIDELVSLGKEAFTDASMFENLSRATGLSTDAIQRMAFVGVEFGVQTEQMARGVEQLSAKLANGDANATKAVQMLGLSITDLLAAGPEEAFLQMAEATGRVEDPMLKAALASDEFGGKLAKILLPALGELRQKMLDVPQSALMSKETIDSAHAFDTGLEHLTITLKAATAEVIIGSSHWYDWAGSFPLLSQAMLMLSNDLKSHAHDIKLVSDAHVETISTAQLLQNRLDALRTEAMAPLSDVQKDQIVELKAWGESEKDIAPLIDSNVVAVHKYIESLAETKTASAALQKASDATWASMLAQKKLEEKEVLEVTKLWDEYNDLVGSGSGTAYDKAGAAIDKWFNDLVAKNVAANTDTAEFYAAASALDDAKWAHLNANTAAADVHTQEHALQEAAAAQQAYDQALKMESEGTAHFTSAWLETLRQSAADAAATANSWSATLGPALDGITAKVQVVTAAATAMNYALNPNPGGAQQQKDLQYVTKAVNESAAGFAGGTIDPGVIGRYQSAIASGMAALGYRADGGPVLPGQSYVVGERGPETLVMGSSGGTILPNGGGGDTIHIHITQPLGTPAAIAAAVDQALMARRRNTGARS